MFPVSFLEMPFIQLFTTGKVGIIVNLDIKDIVVVNWQLGFFIKKKFF